MTFKKSVFSCSQVNSIFVLVVVVKTILPGGGPYAAHGSYFQYLDVPGNSAYNFGFHRGNTDHFVSRFQQGKDWKFRAKVNWFDKHAGLGEQYWEYNHIDKTGGHGKDGQEHGSGEISAVLGTYGSPPVTYHTPLPANGHGESYSGPTFVDHQRSIPHFEDHGYDQGTGSKGHSGRDNSFGVLVESIKSSLEKPLEEYLNEEVLYKVIGDKSNKEAAELVETLQLDAKPEASLYSNVSHKAGDDGNKTSPAETRSILDHVPESTNSKIHKSKSVNETHPIEYDDYEEGDYDYDGDDEVPEDDYYHEDDDDDFDNEDEEEEILIRNNETS